MLQPICHLLGRSECFRLERQFAGRVSHPSKERAFHGAHNNLSERDIREYVKKRKISGSTRSELGRRCRDTFTSLKKTCRKLGVSFWEYLEDRVCGRNTIAPLPELIRRRALELTF